MASEKPRSADRHRDPSVDRHLKKKQVKTRVSHATYRALEKRLRDEQLSVSAFLQQLIEGILDGRITVVAPSSPGELRTIE